MKRLTTAGSLIRTQPRFRTKLGPVTRVFTAMSPYARNTSPGQYVLGGQFHLKYAGSTYYHFGQPAALSYTVGIANNMSRTGPQLQTPWYGGKQFNRNWRSLVTYKATTP